MNSDQKVLLGTAPIVNANRYRDLLAKQEIEITLAYNETTCKTGCGHTIEIWAHPDDVQAVVETIKIDSSKNYQGLEFDSALVNQVIDTSKEEAQCPACGSMFSSTAVECPDCGLGFGGG